ncbi:MAG TPA: ferrous iron transporter B, partial [Anaerolineales bacterium]|nr:ferrous iron transporter B [Anaerolineales bacterium]
GYPMLLALNMMDEAGKRGLNIDTDGLANTLGFPVVPTVAVQRDGLTTLPQALNTARPANFHIQYSPEIEQTVDQVIDICAAAWLEQSSISPRSLALMFLTRDRVAEEWLASKLPPEDYHRLEGTRAAAQSHSLELLGMQIQQTRIARAGELSAAALVDSGVQGNRLSNLLGQLTMHPLWGLPVLALVLLVVYYFVGIFGAGTLVGFLENNLFGEIINPWLVEIVERISPFQWLSDILVGKYGLWTMGVTYAFALILPIVTTFFFAFGILEDSGYLPRLAALSNRMFRLLGLNGKAVLPMVLGLGCVTMATLTTRVLETKRDRLLVTLLLALAVPCSAQLGVVMGLLAGVSMGAALLWSGVVVLVLMLVGWLAARLVPGERSQLLVELPPLRIPQLSNVVLKTLARLEWYVKEVVPLFLLGAGLMYLLDLSGILAILIRWGEPLVAGWLGLPAETSAAFIMGFIRRDFGATGLFLMSNQGLLTPVQIVVAMVTITLFIPCIASVMMISKERGWKTALAMFAIIMPLAFVTGGLLNRFLLWTGWGLG